MPAGYCSTFGGQFEHRIAAGVGANEAIEQTRLIRLRPILIAAMVAALGFIPMALNTGVGAEVQ